uniref:Uncharacterized protein n=1 Tax=Arundo donax TaxID=35708 RepID=A0A0A9KKA3_ARUDO
MRHIDFALDKKTYFTITGNCSFFIWPSLYVNVMH